MFSGNVRDFASFKRKFEAIAVSTRPVETVQYLRQAVPSEYRHLLDNLDLPDYENMMMELNRVFGSKRLVVSDAFSRIEEVEVIKTDEEFLEFVEKLETIESDLRYLGMLEEISNSFVKARWSPNFLYSSVLTGAR